MDQTVPIEPPAAGVWPLGSCLRTPAARTGLWIKVLLPSQPSLLSWGRRHLESLTPAGGQPYPQVARIEPDGDAEPMKSWLSSPSPPATGSSAPSHPPPPPAPYRNSVMPTSQPTHRTQVAASPPGHHLGTAVLSPLHQRPRKDGHCWGEQQGRTPAFKKQRACPLTGPTATIPPASHLPTTSASPSSSFSPSRDPPHPTPPTRG